jgi:hypothetical protein
MGLYKSVVNPHTGDSQLVYDGTIITFKDSVVSQANLPLTGNSQGDARIANDTGNCYVWNIPDSTGDLSDWANQGDIIDLVWSAIDGKPSSSVSDIDDAVTKKHSHSNKTELDKVTDGDHDVRIDNPHSVSKSQVGLDNVPNLDTTDAINKAHDQDSDTKLDEGGSNELSASEILVNIYNNILNAFRISVNGSLTVSKIINGMIDVYIDQNGIDTGNSVNQIYDSVDDFYYPDQGVDSNYKLLLHLNGSDGATSTTDSSPSGHSITFNGNAELDTAIKKWGTASLRIPADTGDYLSIADSADWDFVSAVDTQWTIDFWLAMADTSGFNNIFSQYEDSNNYFLIYHESATSGLAVEVKSGGGTIINMASGNPGKITDTDLHHIMFYRNGSTYGLYIDGTQVAYLSDASTDTFAGELRIGTLSGAGNGASGNFDEVRVYKGNLFGANPDAGITDTITVPTGETSFTPTNMTLISDSFPAESQPDKVRFACLEKDVDTVTLNTDLKAYASRDDGITFTQGTLVDKGDYDADKRFLVAEIDVSGQPAGTDMVYKLVTDNLKELQIHASGKVWN